MRDRARRATAQLAAGTTLPPQLAGNSAPSISARVLALLTA